MRRLALFVVALAIVALPSLSRAHGAGQTVTCTTCPIAAIDARASRPLGPVTAGSSPRSCHPTKHNGFPTPDPACTPGAINPTVTVAVLRDPAFRTGCLRDCATSSAAKGKTYSSYGIAKPANNTGLNMTCELDHLVSLEIGGADTIDNIWPQCGPANVVLARRFFKQKDMVENFLGDQVKSGLVDNRRLATIQKLIAEDWTQFLPEATRWCAQPGHGC